MARREKKPVHKVVMTEGKRNIIQQLLQEYDIETAEDLLGYRYEALFQLAAAKMPNARDQIRREFRRRGLAAPMLVGDKVLEQHMSVSRRPGLSGPH